MNYLLGGTTAPTIWETDGTYETDNTLRVTWRLIWEDRRYIDGTITAEGRAYFPAAAPVASRPVFATDDTLTSSSGAICPQSGLWAVGDDLSAKTQIESGAVIPQHGGRHVQWVWVAK